MYPRAIEICISESYSRLVALMILAALHNRKLFQNYSGPMRRSQFTTQRAALLCRELIPELPGLLHRELHPVFCAESYSRSVVPRATLRFGLVCRELLPVCCAESYSRSLVPRSICYFSVRSPTNWSVAPRRSVQRRHLEQQLQSRPRATVCCAERLVCRELLPDGCDYVVSNAFCEVANNPLVQRHVGSGRRVAT